MKSQCSKARKVLELFNSCEDDYEFATLLDAVQIHLEQVHESTSEKEETVYSEAAKQLGEMVKKFKKEYRNF